MQALAAGLCAAPAAACGGAVSSLDPQADADVPDRFGDDDWSAPDVRVDSEPPPDAGFDVVVHDVVVFDEGPDHSVPHDASFDQFVPPDVSYDVTGCVALGAKQSCTPIPYSCLPPPIVPGYNQASACNDPCGPGNFGCQAQVPDVGFPTITCLCGGGRFPAGLVLLDGGARRPRDPLGAVLARNAALESAAVRAFEQLARELAAHDAPEELVAGARRAARQEVVHARLLRRAAAARGCKTPRTRALPAPARARSLRRIALENAVEGCAREAIGAALLELQARRCPDAELRPVLARIAAEEIEHAEFSWRLHAWLMSRLDSEQRASVIAAHEAFLDTCERTPPPESADPRLAGALGMPTPAQWTALVRAVRWGLRSLRAA